MVDVSLSGRDAVSKGDLERQQRRRPIARLRPGIAAQVPRLLLI